MDRFIGGLTLAALLIVRVVQIDLRAPHLRTLRLDDVLYLLIQLDNVLPVDLNIRPLICMV